MILCVYTKYLACGMCGVRMCGMRSMWSRVTSLPPPVRWITVHVIIATSRNEDSYNLNIVYWWYT